MNKFKQTYTPENFKEFTKLVYKLAEIDMDAAEYVVQCALNGNCKCANSIDSLFMWDEQPQIFSYWHKLHVSIGHIK